jgi:hypothetical protein
MKPTHARRRIGGFTGWDALICAGTALLLVTSLPALIPSRGCKAPAARISCVSKLKQINLAFRMWANDHGDQFPWEVTSEGTNGGTKEFVLTGETWRHFQAVSNELNSPKVLACPSDSRKPASDWTSFTNHSHLSYFVGLDADETKPQTILTGDRNLTSPTAKPVKGVLALAATDRAEWTQQLHKGQGNLGLADESAMQVNNAVSLGKQFQAAFNSTTQAVFRLALPE